MFNQPKRTKYSKRHKGRNRGKATKGNNVVFGEFGLKSSGRGRLNARQIESARRVIVKAAGKHAKLWIRTFPDKPISKKPLEVRQGKGKGPVDCYVCEIKPGHIIFELEGVDADVARAAFNLASNKLPFPVIFEERTVM